MKIQFKYMYVLFIPQLRFFYRAKIGISNDVQRRVKEIRDSIWNETRREADVRVFIKIPFVSTEHWEGRIHRLTRFAAAKMVGSGRTEWRWSFNPIMALLCGVFGSDMHWPNGEVFRFLFVFFLPLPFDFAAIVILAFFAELLAVLAVLFAAYKFITLIL